MIFRGFLDAGKKQNLFFVFYKDECQDNNTCFDYMFSIFHDIENLQVYFMLQKYR